MENVKVLPLELVKWMYDYLDDTLNQLLGEDSSSKEEIEELVNRIKELEVILK